MRAWPSLSSSEHPAHFSFVDWPETTFLFSAVVPFCDAVDTFCTGSEVSWRGGAMGDDGSSLGRGVALRLAVADADVDAADLAQAVQRQLLPVKVTRSPVGNVLLHPAQRKHCWKFSTQMKCWKTNLIDKCTTTEMFNSTNSQSVK